MSNLLKSTHEGKIKLGEIELNVAVLSDGTRIISQSAIFKAFGRTKRGRAKKETRVLNMPSFIDANNLQPFVSPALREVLVQIEYINKNGKVTSDYNALILPLLCKVYLDARAAKNPSTGKSMLIKAQEPLARASEILLLGLSNIGITSLIDEATGYQYDREKDELQKILKSYISQELLPWQKRFPDIYYKELFRLNGWDFTVNGIKKRPGVIGKWTNTLIYNQLPDGVLKELKEKTPKHAQLHRMLTMDVGEPNLSAQIQQVVTLFQLSDNMKHMWNQFEKLKARQSGQLSLPFEFDEAGRTVEPVSETQKHTEAELFTDFDRSIIKAVNFNPKDK